MVRRVRLLVVCAVASATVSGALAGCGGGGETTPANEYVKAINTAQQAFRGPYLQTRRDLDDPANDSAAVRQALDRFGQAADQLATTLRTLTPPKRVATLHRQLIADVERFGPAIRARRDAANGSARGVLRAATRFTAKEDAISGAIGRELQAINDRLH